MITKLLIGFLLTAELLFVIWNLKTKEKHNRIKMYYRLGCAGALSILVFLSVLEGWNRYGILIVALLLQGGLGLCSRKVTPVKPLRQFAALIGNMLLYIVALFPAILFPQYDAPQVTGTHAVATAEYTWVDENRAETYSDTGEHRAVTVKFWYPEENGSYPLILFSHGATGVIDSNLSTYTELASNGYVVASIGHPYQAMYVEDTTGKVTVIDMDFLNEVMTDNGSDDPAHEKAVYDRSRNWMTIRTGDVNFVLDTILCAVDSKGAEYGELQPFSRINPDSIGLFGHSLGGATMVMVGRQRTDIDAVICLEGTMLGEYTGYKDNEYVFNEEPYPLPLLDVNSRVVYEEASGYADRQYVNFYVGEHAPDFHEVIFNDAAHLNFTDLPLVSPPLAKMLGTGEVNPKTCIENVNEMVLHFFDYYLKEASELNIAAEY